MSSFSGELRVGGHVFPLLEASYSATQATDRRGRVIARVRRHPVELLLDVPRHGFLEVWAHEAHKRLPADVVFRQAAGGSAWETLRMAAAYCVEYSETFHAGDDENGAYVCRVVLADPDGWTLHAGDPAAYVAPAARDHGVPPVASATLPGSNILSDCTESVRQNLQNQVKQNCKNGKQSCLITDDCPVLEQTMETLNACIAARTKINMKCFKDGDAGHQKQILDKINGLVRCQEYYFNKCNKSSQLVPVPRKVPSNEPVNLPSVPKEVPLTIAGVGLFILYLLSGALRPGPI